MKKTISASLLVLVGAVALVGCGDDDDTPAPQATVTVTESAQTTPTAPASEDTGGAPSEEQSSDPAAGLPPKPGFDQCVNLEPAADGAYTVYDAGSAVVTRDGNRLDLGDVQAAEGWTSRIDSEERDEVEIEFRTGTDQLDLEVEIDDGTLQVQICNDDD